MAKLNIRTSQYIDNGHPQVTTSGVNRVISEIKGCLWAQNVWFYDSNAVL